VLEPSAGTGALVDALDAVPGAHVVAVEINPTLADNLRLRSCTTHEIRCADFLACNGDLGTFDRIVMNPPFERGSDIKHVEHALTFLRPGGRLAAIVANGPRQQASLMERATHWEELPEGTFAGTGVRAAICVMEAP
jgi:16S rRNA G1207 methylase RsmC